jgi:hypothetical protein
MSYLDDLRNQLNSMQNDLANTDSDLNNVLIPTKTKLETAKDDFLEAHRKYRQGIDDDILMNMNLLWSAERRMSFYNIELVNTKNTFDAHVSAIDAAISDLQYKIMNARLHINNLNNSIASVQSSIVTEENRIREEERRAAEAAEAAYQAYLAALKKK